IHTIGKKLQFVDESNVHAAINIFEKFDQFRRPRGRNGNNPVDDLPVKRLAHFEAIRREAANDLWDCPRRELRIPRVFALGRENQEVIFAGLETGWTESLKQYFFGCSGIRSAFQRYKLSLAKRFGNCFSGLLDVLKVGILFGGERGWHADDDAIGF